MLPCGTDCNDAHPGIHPDADEVCDGVDNNCAGVETCDATGEWSGVCAGEVVAIDEAPNGLDDNCDGAADEGLWAVTTPCPDGGAVWRVVGGAEPGGNGLTWPTAFDTLDGALAAADECDEIWVSGTLGLTGPVAIDSPIRIYGGFAGDETERSGRDPVAHVTTLDGGGTARCLSITAGTLLDGVTVTGCFNDQTSDGGAVAVSGAPLHVRNSVFTGNVNFRDVTSPDSAHGGAILATGGASLSIEGSHFEGNHSRYRGGAVAVLDTDLLVRDTWFIDNVAADEDGRLGSVLSDGGALYASGPGTVTIIDSTFEGNRSASNAVCVRQSDLFVLDSVLRDHGCSQSACEHDEWYDGFSIITVRIDESTAVVHGTLLEGNSLLDTPDIASGSSGVLDAVDGAHLTVLACDFVGNHNLALSASDLGTTLDVRDSVFSGNARSLYTSGVPLTVSHSRFELDTDRFWTVLVNSIQEPTGLATFTDCTFADNEGVALTLLYADAVLDGSVLQRNAGHFYGGALALDRSNLTVTNSVHRRSAEHVPGCLQRELRGRGGLRPGAGEGCGRGRRRPVHRVRGAPDLAR